MHSLRESINVRHASGLNAPLDVMQKWYKVTKSNRGAHSDCN